MIAHNTALIASGRGGKYLELSFEDYLHPVKHEPIKDPMAEAMKRLNRMGIKVVSENEPI